MTLDVKYDFTLTVIEKTDERPWLPFFTQREGNQ